MLAGSGGSSGMMTRLSRTSRTGGGSGGGGMHVPFSRLRMHRVVGTGQFGIVRQVSDASNGRVYALKIMSKASMVEGKQIEHVSNERHILDAVRDCPFCVNLVGAYQDAKSLYLLQEWVPGGELFHHLDVQGAFSDAVAAFFAANVVLALEYLHSRNIVYRDLKPENLLLDDLGYLKMADFGFAKTVSGKTYTICGTPDYQAPEVITRCGTTRSADFWGLGVLIFEMLVGDPPFKSLTGDPWDTFRRALSGRFFVPAFISEAASDIIFKLLQVNPEKRLGMGPAGISEIKSHVFFAGVNWQALAARRVPSPIVPNLRNAIDTSYFSVFEEDTLPEARAVVADRSGAGNTVLWADEEWEPVRDAAEGLVL